MALQLVNALNLIQIRYNPLITKVEGGMEHIIHTPCFINKDKNSIQVYADYVELTYNTICFITDKGETFKYLQEQCGHSADFIDIAIYNTILFYGLDLISIGPNHEIYVFLKDNKVISSYIQLCKILKMLYKEL